MTRPSQRRSGQTVKGHSARQPASLVPEWALAVAAEQEPTARAERRIGHAAALGPSWGRETAVTHGQPRCLADNENRSSTAVLAVMGTAGPYMAWKTSGELRPGLLDLAGSHIGLHRRRPADASLRTHGRWSAVMPQSEARATAVWETAGVPKRAPTRPIRGGVGMGLCACVSELTTGLTDPVGQAEAGTLYHGRLHRRTVLSSSGPGHSSSWVASRSARA